MTDTRDPAQPRRHLTLAVGGERCAIGIDSIREILEVPSLTQVPMVPPVVRGVMNLRGAVVPVIDLAQRLGLPATSVSRRSCVVIVERGEGRERTRLGLLVDAVQAVLEVLERDVEPVPAIGTRIDPLLLEAIVRTDGGLLSVLALERVLDEDDLVRIAGAGALAA